MSLEQFFPPLETALQLEPEELAIPLLKCLIKEEKSRAGQLNLHNFAGTGAIDAYAGDKVDEVVRAITEAWIWLEREGMIAPNAKLGIEWKYVTKRGQELAASSDISEYIKSNIIPRNSLDPVLASKVLPLFIRGDYDTAVFQAFKEVEIRVRNAASLPPSLIGVELMRKALNADDGPLTDMSRPKAEREAMSHLFAGAIGLFKNPSSHRDVDWDDPRECAELIYLANHFLRIVEKHSGKEWEALVEHTKK